MKQVLISMTIVLTFLFQNSSFMDRGADMLEPQGETVGSRLIVKPKVMAWEQKKVSLDVLLWQSDFPLQGGRSAAYGAQDWH